MDYPGIKNKVRKGEYLFDTKEKEPLEEMNMVSDVWPQPPSHNQIHIYITLRPGMSTTLVQGAGEYFMSLVIVTIFVVVIPIFPSFLFPQLRTNVSGILLSASW